MPTNLTIEFHNIRPHGGSRDGGFEELVTQLLSHENTPSGSRFIRLAPPDAGVEAYWKYADGTEWGIQAKYFLTPTAIDWRQVDKSVKRALLQHQNLRHYTISFATDLSDPRGDLRQTAQLKWEQRRQKYIAWAQERHMDVEFDLWGKSELTKRLIPLPLSGLRYYFFRESELSPEWFADRLQRSIANAGDRYTPEQNVYLELEEQLSRALGNGNLAYDALAAIKRLRKTSRSLNQDRTVARLGQTDVQLLVESIDTIQDLTDRLRYSVPAHVMWSTIAKTCSDAALRLFTADENHGATEAPQRDGPMLRPLRQALEELRDLASSGASRLAETRRGIIAGTGGIGKTHLLCRTVEHCIKRDLPAILLLGDSFDTSPIESQIVRELGLSCTSDELFGALQAAAQASRSIALIAIDALNEGPGGTLWRKRLPGFLKTLERYDRIIVIMTVRDVFELEVLPQPLPAMERFEHRGFEGHELDAIDAYFSQHGVITPSIPLMLPEFRNPLFVKLLARAVKLSGSTMIPPGLHGLRNIFDYYLMHIERSICDERGQDSESRPVISALRDIAQAVFANSLSRQAAISITERYEAGRSLEFTRSLYKLLLGAGILTEIPSYSRSGMKFVRFTYQRLSDMIVAEALVEATAQLTPNGARLVALRRIIKDALAKFEFGVIEALALVLPETTQLELPDVTTEARVKDDFLATLAFRDSSSITARTLQLFDDCLSHTETARHGYEVLFITAALPDHPLNWEYLDRRLRPLALAQRDAAWTIHIARQPRAAPLGERLINWSEGSRSAEASEDVREAVATTLCWLFTSSDRTLRDRASKALVNLLDRGPPNLFQKLLQRYVDCNDPYVIERVLAAGFGTVTRTRNKNLRAAVAEAVLRDVFTMNHVPVDALSRDFARLIVEAAVAIEAINLSPAQLAAITPPYGSGAPAFNRQPLPSNDLAVIDESSAEWGLFAIRMSVGKHGDFGRYVMRSDHPSMFPFTNISLRDPEPRRADDLLTEFELTAGKSERSILRGLVEKPKRFRYVVIHSIEEAQASRQKTLSARRRATLKSLRALVPLLTSAQKALIKSYFRALDRNSDALKGEQLSAWVYRRVLELGYDGAVFGSYDLWLRDARLVDPITGETHRIERIGKKYQWIAYRELLARLSDNFRTRRSELGAKYEDSSRLHIRDIDPTCLLRGTREERFVLKHDAYWAPLRFQPRPETSWEQWLRRWPRPDYKQLLKVRDDDGRQWYAVSGAYTWEEDGADSIDHKRLEVWFQLFLLRREAARLLRRRLSRDLQSSPEPLPLYQLFLGEYPWAPAWSALEQQYDEEHDLVRQGARIATHIYLADGSRNDAALEGTFSFCIPSAELVRALGLARSGETNWTDESGDFFAFDPSVAARGPSALLLSEAAMRSLMNLREYEPVWLLGGQQMVVGSRGQTGPGYTRFAGTCEIQDDASLSVRVSRRFESHSR